MLSIVVPLLAGAETHVELPVPPFVYGLLSLVVFAMMLAALFAFRQAATKLARPENTVVHEPTDPYEGHGVYGHGDDEAHH
ncbi:hypothetical protein [Janibacter alittae]|uniref:Uncharacterized protein n=1 Tax=Janibacter alittae TaxID=3115209 RepID=A0ABZ2MKA3_9MICO